MIQRQRFHGSMALASRPRPRASGWAGLALALTLLLAASGCRLDPWSTSNQNAWDFPDAGAGADVYVPDPDACVPTEERCDGTDNDCNGLVDDVAPSVVADDPDHCGGCFQPCDLYKAVPGCQDATCVVESCYPSYWDLDGDPGNGCEYQCAGAPGVPEICDGVDNNCDGQTDEGFDLQIDPQNCGQCGRLCAFYQGEGTCVGGQCQLHRCEGGYVDKDGDPDNGCECRVLATEDATACDELNPVDCGAGEICADLDEDGVSHCAPVPPDGCDGLDTDCDGQIDEDATALLGTAECYTHPVGCTESSPGDFSCTGECQAGTLTCVGGNVLCGGQVGPAAEQCDGVDNDCDGQIDEDFDLQIDPANCGSCGLQCAATVANAVPGCSAGQCVVLACLVGYHDVNGDPADGCEYACTLTNGGVDACGDGVDNDCDGDTDEGFDFQSDPQNCGSCGYDCSQHAGANSQATGCSGGACQYACLSGFLDLDGDVQAGDAGTGCEYACTQTNGGVEACDGADNDCDSDVDEDFDLQSDPTHCGACGNDCSAMAGASSSATGCSGGQCVYQCDADHWDLNGDLVAGSGGDGCEYACTQTNGGVEACDGADNDCDGDIDEDSAGLPLTRTCYSPGYGADTGCDAPGSCTGTCQEGSETCSGGDWSGVCVNEVVPRAERCDGADDDCDDDIDEDYDLQNDLNHCGDCAVSCWDSPPPNAYPVDCVSGQCQYACELGYNDVNGDLHTSGGDGCEYACPENPPGVEYCDGVDNDCDGAIDDGLTPPSGLCYQGTDGPEPPAAGTDENNPCLGVTAACEDPDGTGPLSHDWYCQWPASVEVDPANPNQILGYETRCDGWDGDCNGTPDDDFTLLGEPCDDGGIGACQGTGEYVCDSTGTDVQCQITDPGASPTTETCNGVDDDCDGSVDEDTPGQMAHVVTATLDFYIDVYEASRPDATSLGGGSMDHVACSEPDRIPWYLVDWADAAAACAAAGKRLCTEAEWQAACEGAAGNLYPYGNTYDAETCNGEDYDPDCTAPDDDWVQATGAPHGCPPPATTQCLSDDGVVDQSGNLMEWTGTQVGSSPTTYRIRGGSYFSIEPALTCDFDFISAEPDYRYDDLGFRCCADTYPP